MRFFYMILMVLVMALALPAGMVVAKEEKDVWKDVRCGGILIADTAFSTPTCVREFKTPLGKFTIKVDFPGGHRREVVVSPKGGETEMRGVALLRAMAGRVWAVDLIGVWLYDPKAGVFKEIKRLDDVQVSKCFSTKKGYFCVLLPRNGESTFVGLLYFDRAKKIWMVEKLMLRVYEVNGFFVSGISLSLPEQKVLNAAGKYNEDEPVPYVVDDITVTRDGRWLRISARWYDMTTVWLARRAGFIYFNLTGYYLY